MSGKWLELLKQIAPRVTRTISGQKTALKCDDHHIGGY